MPTSARFLVVTIATCLSACVSTLTATTAKSTSTFTFVVVGDTAYNGSADEAAYGELIVAINARQPAFTIHVGDTKGAGSCNDAFQERIRDGFSRYDHPIIYTPGDNEWTDCHRPVNGGGDPVERLAAVRRIFFNDDQSFGARPLALAVQSSAFPENRSWRQSDVLFATVHIVGSNNNIATPEEFGAREAAGVAWIEAAFAEAAATKAKALVLAFQAELFTNPSPDDGFARTRETIAAEGTRAGIPVLLVHGDSHRFMFDRPLYRSTSDGKAYYGANIFRLQTFGAPELGAVEVRFEDGSAAPFSFSPVYRRQSENLG
jgi:hypothetical protein